MEAMHAERFALALYGLRLGTRLEGQRVRSDLIQALRALPERGVLVVDCGGVEVLSGSFADETLVEAVAWLAEDAFPARYLVAQSPDLESVEDLDARLAQRKLALLCLINRSPHVLGHLAPYLEQALLMVLERREITSQELAHELNVSIQGAAVRLGSLAKLRLVHLERESRTMGGRQNRARSFLPQLPTRGSSAQS